MHARLVSQVFAIVIFAVCCAASTVVVRDNHIRLPVARRFNFNHTGGSSLLNIDQARAKALKSRTRGLPSQVRSEARSAPDSVPATNGAVTYTVEVSVGTPAQTFDLIIDIGSTTTVVPISLSKPVESGDDTRDSTLTLPPSNEVLVKFVIGSITIPQQAISTESTFDSSGILGIGPTVIIDDPGEVPTVVDNAFSLGLIPSKQVGIAFEPTTSISVTNGELTLGGIDTTKFTGQLATVPITSTSPANEFFGLDQTVSYGETVILSETAGIVDTGTTLILLATNALNAYQKAIGATLDENTGLLTITSAQFAKLQSLFFNIGGITYEITPNAQLWPRALNTAIGGEAGALYVVVGDLGSPSGEGLDFINGFAFLERFYAVVDSGASTVSFAETAFTFAETN